MRLHNTLSGRLEPFHAEEDVRMYVCGITPYDTTHLGHARTYVVFDVLLRWLRRQGYLVRYVQNVTDVDESILARAAELGEPPDELGARYTRVFFEDLAALNILPADLFPTARAGIQHMIDMIQRLEAAGHAYRVDGDVFFRIASFPAYGQLSRLARSEMLAIAAQQDDVDLDDRRKEDPLDFILWHSSAPGEPAWPSPWGDGRPGWHIECSALATAHLGPPLEVHGGGEDLIFPHHESEIAQAEGAGGPVPFARFWMHVGLVRLDGRKMSKSAGNMVFARDLLAQHRADALRLYLLGTRYREPLDHSPEALRDADELAARMADAARRPPVADASAAPGVEALTRRFEEALADDLDTPKAIAVLEELAALVTEDYDGRAQRALLELSPILGLEL